MLVGKQRNRIKFLLNNDTSTGSLLRVEIECVANVAILVTTRKLGARKEPRIVCVCVCGGGGQVEKGGSTFE
jgi:hypothetical protein